MHGIRCECTVPDNLSALSDATATHLYHIAREAVTNATRHADPDCVRIDLDVTDGRGTMSVADNGTWKAPETNSGVGLRIMHHRATLIDAELTFDHAAGTGTTVTCRFPI
jgi:signal transduction histidine kinase